MTIKKKSNKQNSPTSLPVEKSKHKKKDTSRSGYNEKQPSNDPGNKKI